MILNIQFIEQAEIFNIDVKESPLTFVSSFGEVIKVGNAEDDANMYILVTEDGREIPAVLVDELTVFDATPNDIRIGKTAATEQGVTLGEKEIPSYHTIEGTKLITPGKEIIISFSAYDVPHYDYTKLQTIICSFNTSLSNSVAAQKVSIGDAVYNVNSVEKLSSIIKNDNNKQIEFGIINDSDKPCIVRFITYKELE